MGQRIARLQRPGRSKCGFEKNVQLIPGRVCRGLGGRDRNDQTSGRRLSDLIALQRKIQREIHESDVGAGVEVLVEREARTAGDLLGRTEGNKVVVFPAGRIRIGDFVPVRLLSTTGATFLGRVVQ